MSRGINPYLSFGLLLRAGSLLALVLCLLLANEIPGIAQSGPVVWSSHTNLSDSPEASAHPAIVADDYGLVHVFWSEEVGGRPVTPEEGINNTGNSIFYRRWDGSSWSTPLDVLYVPGEVLAEWPVVAIDAENWLHVVWESMTNVYYASAPSWQAGSAHNWTMPLALTTNSASTPWGASITADAEGILHAVYAGSGVEKGLNYIRSTDGGESWSVPFTLYRQISQSVGPPSMVQIVVDGVGRLHAVWQANHVDAGASGVYYARSTNGGDTWLAPVQLATREPEDFSVGTPYLMADGDSELHLIYVDGAYIGSKGRYHRISRDGGATWSAPVHLITELVGINSRVIPIVDGGGQVHLIANMRTEADQVVGIYYSRWQGTGWSPVEPVDVSLPQIHYTAVAVRLGNELHIVYNQLQGAEVYHIRGRVSQLNPQPALALPASVPPTRLTQVVEATPTTTVVQPQTEISSTTGEMLPSQISSAGIHPLLPAAALALMMVVAVTVWARIRSR